MANPARQGEPPAGTWALQDGVGELGRLFLRARRLDPCAERVAIELERHRSLAELAAISRLQAETLASVMYAVFNQLELTDEQQQRAIEITVAELRRAAREEPG